MSEEQKQLKLFQSKEELFKEAENNISLAPEGLKNAIKFYYVSRYFVAIYESRYQEVPIQVWNEYRNALDHFFRHLTAGGNLESLEDVTTHPKKMEGHLQRAALDVLKIFSHKSHDSVLTLKKEHNPKILKLVDNGLFIKNLNDEIHRATSLFELAKVSDSCLGNDSVKNNQVLEMYLDAAFAFDQLQCQIIDKTHDINHASEQYEQIHSHAHNHSFFQGITIHVVAGILIGVAVTLGSILMPRYFPSIQLKYTELTHPDSTQKK